MNFILGLLSGIGLGLVFAPASGEETRQRIINRFEAMKGQAVEKGRQQAGDLGQAVGEKLFDKAVGEER